MGVLQGPMLGSKMMQKKVKKLLGCPTADVWGLQHAQSKDIPTQCTWCADLGLCSLADCFVSCTQQKTTQLDVTRQQRRPLCTALDFEGNSYQRLLWGQKFSGHKDIKRDRLPRKKSRFLSWKGMSLDEGSSGYNKKTFFPSPPN
jgi:hypothetical protein